MNNFFSNGHRFAEYMVGNENRCLLIVHLVKVLTYIIKRRDRCVEDRKFKTGSGSGRGSLKLYIKKLLPKLLLNYVYISFVEEQLQIVLPH